MSLSESRGSSGSSGEDSLEDQKGLSRREKLQGLSVSVLNRLKEDGEDDAIRKVESALQEEAEEVITEELGLENYISPAEFVIPRESQESPISASLQKFFGQGRENGVYSPLKNAVVISTDYGELNGLMENNLFSTAVHELVHSDTYNRLTGADEVIHPSGLRIEIEDIGPLQKSLDEENNVFDVDPKESIIDELNKEYKITKFELVNLSEEARGKISELSERYNSSGKEEGILEEAYEVVQGDIDVYHLNSLDTQPEKEAFAWFGSMYAEGDLEDERSQLNRESELSDQYSSFEVYERGSRIEDELESLVGMYDNLIENAEMKEAEALNYIFEEVQPRKFDYRAKQIRRNLENTDK